MTVVDPPPETAPGDAAIAPAAERARAGVGSSENPSSRQAGEEAARMALERSGLEDPDLVLLFCSGKHDAAAFHEGVRSVAGTRARMIGGSTMGVITNDFLGYEGHQVGVAVISAPGGEIDVLAEDDLRNRNRDAGVALGGRLREAGLEDANLVLVYDSVKEQVPEGFSLNTATLLIDGLEEGMRLDGGAWPSTAGVGVIGDVVFGPTWQFADDRVEQQLAVALRAAGGVRMDTVIMHGCRPSGRYMEITATDGPLILEIEGRPALEVIDELLGGGRDWAEYPLFVTLGANRGDKFGDFREENWVNRLCMGIDRERGALIMAEPDLVAGTEVQLMRRTIDLDYVGERTRELLDSLEGRRPFFALYIDCAIRASAFCELESEEAAEVQAALGDVPLLGMYSGVEIAVVRGRPNPLDFTGVLCVFSEEA